MPIGKSFKKIFLDEGFALLSSSHPAKEELTNRVLSFTGRLGCGVVVAAKSKTPFSVVTLKNSTNLSSVRYLWMKCCGWGLRISEKTPCSINRTPCLSSYWAVDSSKSELFQIQFSNVMSYQWRLSCLEFHL